ncbi:MAG: flagellar export protein FliJ [bacterium]
MPFKFNNILEYRKLIEDKSYVEFSKVQKEYIKINLNINNIKNKIEDFKLNYSKNASGISSINDFLILESGYQGLINSLDTTLREKDIIEKELEKRRLYLLQSKIEFEKIKKLKDKYLAIDKLNLIKKEEMILNDLTSNKYNTEQN